VSLHIPQEISPPEVSRRTWLAGSLPGKTPTEAMTLALDHLGGTLLGLPAGETSRSNWTISIAEELAQRADQFKVIKEGDNTDYNDLTQLAPIDDLHDLDLGYYTVYTTERNTARELVGAYELVPLPFQQGIPSPFSLAGTAVGLRRSLRWYPKFAAATTRDIARIYAEDATVIFQIEAAWDLVAVLITPGFARSVVIHRLVDRLVELVSSCPAGANFGMHLCVGDMNHRAKGRLPQLLPVVDFINVLCERWPAANPLVYVHVPLAEANLPPVLEPSWYVELSALAVPPVTRIVAGLCHERVTTEQLRPVLDVIDVACGRQVAVGASCGLALRGDRTMDDVYTVLNQQRELCCGG
jgi:hypothetical protein